MARIRTIKPGFWANETLADLSPWHRLSFIGLWNQADREGRIEDRPRRIKAILFPYDDDADMGVSMEAILADLDRLGFIVRYEVGGSRYIALPNFARHQLISRDEPASEIPGPDGELTPYERAPNETVRARIYQRDNYICMYCGRDLTKHPRLRCVDHVVPYIRGGSHREINLVTACKACNGKKGNKTPDEAQMPWPQGFGYPLTDGQHPVNGSVLLGEGEKEIGIRHRAVGGEEAADGAATRTRAEDFVELWNTVTTPPIPRCRDLTSKRRRHIKARMTERPLTEWLTVFEKIQASAFCRGEVGVRGNRTDPWVASFDWVIGSPDVAVKVLEGAYDDRKPAARAEKRPWWEECQELHGGQCDKQWNHELRKQKSVSVA